MRGIAIMALAGLIALAGIGLPARGGAGRPCRSDAPNFPLVQVTFSRELWRIRCYYAENRLYRDVADFCRAANPHYPLIEAVVKQGGPVCGYRGPRPERRG